MITRAIKKASGAGAEWKNGMAWALIGVAMGAAAVVGAVTSRWASARKAASCSSVRG